MPEIFDRVAEVIRATFKQPELRISPATTADDVRGWDSLAHARLLMNLEQAFHIRFVIDDVLDLENVGELATAVRSAASETPDRNPGQSGA
jgi:acyl carrier protein